MASSTSKVKRKAQSRNILKCPQNTPKVPSDEDVEILKQTLESCLRRIFVKRLKVSWNQLKRVAKEERALLKRRLSSSALEEGAEEASALRKECFCIGVNEVARGLEDGQMAACILAADAQPFILVEHLVTLAHVANVPFVVYPALKELTKQQLGFHAIAIGLKKGIEEKEEVFVKAIELIKEVGGVEGGGGGGAPRLTPNAIIARSPPNEAKEQQRRRQWLHLLRKEAGVRAFHPPPAAPQVGNEEEGFIGLVERNDPSQDDHIHFPQLNPHYRPPLIHKLQSNPHKVRKTKHTNKKS